MTENGFDWLSRFFLGAVVFFGLVFLVSEVKDNAYQEGIRKGLEICSTVKRKQIMKFCGDSTEREIKVICR